MFYRLPIPAIYVLARATESTGGIARFSENEALIDPFFDTESRKYAWIMLYRGDLRAILMGWIHQYRNGTYDLVLHQLNIAYGMVDEDEDYVRIDYYDY